MALLDVQEAQSLAFSRRWPRLRCLAARLMVWTTRATLVALLFVRGSELLQEVQSSEDSAFRQGGNVRGHITLSEDQKDLAAVQQPGGEKSKLLSDRAPALKSVGEEVPAFFQYDTSRPRPLGNDAELDTAEAFLQNNGWAQDHAGAEEAPTTAATRVPKTVHNGPAPVAIASKDEETTTTGGQLQLAGARVTALTGKSAALAGEKNRVEGDHEQQWLQIGAHATSENTGTSRTSGASAMNAQKDEAQPPHQPSPLEQQILQMQEKMSMLEVETQQKMATRDAETQQKMATRDAETQQKISALEAETQQKISMLEANATACTNNVTDLVSASADMRHAGGVVEEVGGLFLAHMFAMSKGDYVAAVVYLLSGFAAALIVVALPIRLVFFPREYHPEEESEGGEDVTPGPPQQGVSAVAGGDQADLLSADHTNPPSPKPEKYWLLPWDFAKQGTLSSVCQRPDSTEGKIFTTGLVIAEVCTLLSRYTLIVYDRNCMGWASVVSQRLDSIGTERSIDLAFRVIWLIVPPVLMIITAAVPSNSFGANVRNAARTTTTAGHAAGSGSSTTRNRNRNRVSVIHEDDTRKWSQGFHRTVGAAVALRLIFETRQLFQEPVDLSVALFGLSDPLDGHDLPGYVNAGEQRVVPRCYSESKTSYWTQAYRGYYLGRLVWLFLGWLFSLVFVALQAAVIWQHRHAEDRPAKDRSSQSAAYLGDDRLAPQSASLILPRLSFTAEILAMLTVQALPFWPVLLKVVRHVQGANWVPPLTSLEGLLAASFEHLWGHHPQCGHYFDTDKWCRNQPDYWMWFTHPDSGMVHRYHSSN
ncbi:unnamed protein product [Amoebophrya sp. A120]|nr:unnamed protein product [Amoebophrya sp. A120]|eukprot:GSA120T00001452001.1